MEKLKEAVTSVLQCYECELKKTSHWIDKERSRKSILNQQVKRFFDTDSRFIVRNGYGLFSAASIIMTLPFATVDIIVHDVELFLSKHRSVYEELKKHGYHNAIRIMTESDLSTVTSIAPYTVSFDGPFVLTSPNFLSVYSAKMDKARCSSISFSLPHSHKAVFSRRERSYVCRDTVSAEEISDYFYYMEGLFDESLGLSFLCQNPLWQ